MQLVAEHITGPPPADESVIDGLPPNLTTVAPAVGSKLVPVIVTFVNPKIGPLAGLTPVTVGAGAAGGVPTTTSPVSATATQRPTDGHEMEVTPPPWGNTFDPVQAVASPVGLVD